MKGNKGLRELTCAAATARSMSFALADAMVVRVSPVAGFSTSRVSPSTEGTNSLLMKSPVGTVRDGVSQILFHNYLLSDETHTQIRSRRRP